MKLRKILLLIMISTSLSPWLYSTDTIGKLVDFSGAVRIDVYGNDSFITPVRGDRLYESSIVSTGENSWASVLIDKDEHLIPPGAIVSMDDLFRSRKQDPIRVFSLILDGLFNALKPPVEDIADFGGRASEAGGDSFDMDFFIDDFDADLSYEDGLAALTVEDFEGALTSFLAIEYPEDGSFPLEDYYGYLSICYISQKDFRNAYDSLFSYLNSSPDSDLIELFPHQLQLLSGISAYYSGRFEAARIAFDHYLRKAGLERANAEAVVLYYLLQKREGVDEPAFRGRSISSIRSDINFSSLSGE